MMQQVRENARSPADLRGPLGCDVATGDGRRSGRSGHTDSHRSPTPVAAYDRTRITDCSFRSLYANVWMPNSRDTPTIAMSYLNRPVERDLASKENFVRQRRRLVSERLMAMGSESP
jgi:hypothetical protein